MSDATMAGRMCAGERAIFATMHGKERVVAPLVRRFLGMAVAVPAGLDTDRFGTFARDVPRLSSALDAARQKVAAAFAIDPGASLALASEGSFGPHPHFPFLAIDREIVVLADRASGFELVGQHATASTNYSHRIVQNVSAGLAFAAGIGFPGHGVVVIAVRDGQPAPDMALTKDVADHVALGEAIADIIRRCGAAFVETDMRAHRNPQRMRAMARATTDLIRRARSRCPSCAAPGYVVSERTAGLACADCGVPTLAIRAEIRTCIRCDHRVEQAVTAAAADPRYCPCCNS